MGGKNDDWIGLAVAAAIGAISLLLGLKVVGDKKDEPVGGSGCNTCSVGK